jgi:hypothetical protein
MLKTEQASEFWNHGLDEGGRRWKMGKRQKMKILPYLDYCTPVGCQRTLGGWIRVAVAEHSYQTWRNGGFPNFAAVSLC